MKELVIYLTAGYPSIDFSIEAANVLKEAGADRLELGLAFSDPVADGPVIEAVNHKALANGFRLKDAFDICKQTSKFMPTYMMGYFNNFFSHGLIEFSQQARFVGAKGFIIPDLPLEEAKRYKSAWDSFEIGTVGFAAVTDTKERLELIAKTADDFIYLVAFAGITGADKSEDLSEVLKVLKANTEQKVFVGFGVNEATAKERAKGADGVIVGTALVKYLLDESLSNKEKLDKMKECVKIIKSEINS